MNKFLHYVYFMGFFIGALITTYGIGSEIYTGSASTPFPIASLLFILIFMILFTVALIVGAVWAAIDIAGEFDWKGKLIWAIMEYCVIMAAVLLNVYSKSFISDESSVVFDIKMVGWFEILVSGVCTFFVLVAPKNIPKVAKDGKTNAV